MSFLSIKSSAQTPPSIDPNSRQPELPLSVGMARGLSSDFVADFRSGVGGGRAFKLSLAKRAAQGIGDALVLDDNMGFAAIDTLAANRISNHIDLAYFLVSIASTGTVSTPGGMLHFEYRHSSDVPIIQAGERLSRHWPSCWSRCSARGVKPWIAAANSANARQCPYWQVCQDATNRRITG